MVSNTPENHHLNSDRKDFQPLDGLQILVVDDDIDNCVLTSFLLEGYGVQVITAASALEALELIKQLEPHLLIVDIAMPEVDGYSLISKVRNFHEPLRKIPAIAVTAIDAQEESGFALKYGFQAYLTKPVDPTDLVTEIVKLVH
ncbi:response regulator [Fischerella sp. PCC 9605]|uniref:response regulator n=1 Tax=Fischerella sp. PCC 9605 TaxID=1173024 RepID=UPI0004AF8C3F|nr:response regulator [Fischerella sp. PCC 9605]